MSRHWKPIGAIAGKKRWPEGATAGLVLVAAACLGVAIVLYQVSVPRDVFEAPAD